MISVVFLLVGFQFLNFKFSHLTQGKYRISLYQVLSHLMLLGGELGESWPLIVEAGQSDSWPAFLSAR